MTFEQAVENYYKTRIGVSPGTLRYDKGKLDPLVKYFGHMQMFAINKHDYYNFLAHLYDKNPSIKNNTINKYLMMFNRIFVENDVPVLPIKKLTKEVPIMQKMEEKEINLIFSHFEMVYEFHFEAHRNYLMFRILRDTGVRLNECINIRLKNVNFYEKKILLQTTKKKKDRIVFFTNETKKIFTSYIKKYKIEDSIFVIQRTGRPIKNTTVDDICDKLKVKLQLPYPCTPHRWRRTFATDFLARGGNIEILRILMGHEDLKTTQRYLIYSSKTQKDEYERLYE